MGRDVAFKFSLDVAYDVVQSMEELGFDVSEDSRTILDIMVLVEAVRAMIFRTMGEEYHFQAFSEKMWEEEMDTDKALIEFLDDMDNSIDDE